MKTSSNPSMISVNCSRGFFRIQGLLALLGILTAIPAFCGLREIIPRPQQMGVLFEYPMVISGGFYLVVPDEPTETELLVQEEAIRLFQEASLRSPIVVEYSDFTFDIPSLWIGTPERFPEIAQALDSSQVSELGSISHTEEYQILVEEFRILLLGENHQALRWGLLSLMQLIGDVNGSLHVDRVYLRDWPDWPERIVAIGSPMRVEEQDAYCNALADSAYLYKFNEIEWNNSDIGLAPQDMHPWHSSFFFPHAYAFKDKIKSRGQKLSLSCDATGNLVRDFSWQEAIPITNTKMQVTSSGFQIIPDCYSIQIPNGNFEYWSGDRPQTWFLYRDYIWSHFSRDRSIRHSGTSSIKIQTPGENLNLRQIISVQPYGYYRLRFWAKTSGYSGQFCVGAQSIEVPYGDVIKLTGHLTMAATQDWTEFVVDFSSFHLDELLLMIGLNSLNSGTIWFDDISIEAAEPIRIVRRPDTPLNVYEEPGHVLRTEGVDYRVVETYSTSYNNYVREPRLERIYGGALGLNDIVSIDWGCAVFYQLNRQVVCFSLLEPLQAYQNRIRIADSLFSPDGFKIQINEISYAGHDQLCQSRGLTPAQLVGQYCDNLYNIIQARRPGAPVRVYGDAFDYHCYDPRAMPVTTVTWTRGENGEGTLAQISTDMEIMAMDDYSSNLDSTFITYNQLGFSAVVALYADFPNSIQLQPSLIARKYDNCRGLHTYGWSQFQSKLSLFGSLAWNVGPFIMHTPAELSTPGDSVEIQAEIWGDELASDPPTLTSVVVRYRWLPEGNWIEMNMQLSATDIYSAMIPPGGSSAESLEYSIIATDSRAQIRRAPAGENESFVVLYSSSLPSRFDRSIMHIDHTVTSIDDFTLIEWEPVSSADYYEVHAGSSPDFSEDSQTRIARQSSQSPRYLLRNDELRSVESINVYVKLSDDNDTRRSSRK